MAKFKGAELVCLVCGGVFRVPMCRSKTATTCSHTCSVKFRAQGLMCEKVELQCPVCGITFFEHLSRSKGRRFCSNKCREDSIEYQTAKSDRLRGSGNGAWKGGVTKHSDGYVYESAYSHPYASKGYVLQHRLVVEQHLAETNPESKCLIKLGDNLYLSPELIVHHKNFEKDDNRLDNLQIMTAGAHQRLHNQLRQAATKIV